MSVCVLQGCWNCLVREDAHRTWLIRHVMEGVHEEFTLTLRENNWEGWRGERGGMWKVHSELETLDWFRGLTLSIPEFLGTLLQILEVSGWLPWNINYTFLIDFVQNISLKTTQSNQKQDFLTVFSLLCTDILPPWSETDKSSEWKIMSSVDTNDAKSCERMFRRMERNSSRSRVNNASPNHWSTTSATVLFQLQTLLASYIETRVCTHWDGVWVVYLAAGSNRMVRVDNNSTGTHYYVCTCMCGGQ